VVLGEVMHFTATPAADFPPAAVQADLLYQGGGATAVQRMPHSVWPPSSVGLIEVEVGRLDPASVKLSAAEGQEEAANKEKEIPVKLRVRHLPKHEGTCPGEVAGAASFLKPGSVLDDGRKTQIEAGQQEVPLVVAIDSGLGLVATKHPGGSKNSWFVC
jgi:hypothetical protein